MTQRPHPLLLALDNAVQVDAKPSGLHGTLAVGVVCASGPQWWQVALDGVARSAFVDVPEDKATWFVLGDREARCLAFDGELPNDAQLVKVVGDRSLVDKLSRRYLRRGNVVDVRLGARGVR